MKSVRFIILVIIAALLPSSYVLAAQFNFTPSISVEEEYTDNLFLSPDGFEESEWITRTRLGLEASLLGRSTGLEITYNPAYEWYDEFSDNDGWTHSGLARFFQNFSANTTFEITDTYLQGSDPLGSGLNATPADPLAPSALPTDPSLRGRQETRRNNATARLNHRFGADDSVYAISSYSIYRGLDSPTTVDDSDIWTFGAGGIYWLTNFWGAETDLTYSTRDYDDADDREEWNGRFRLNRRINRHLDVYAQYRHTYLNYTEGILSDYEVYEPTVGFSYQYDQNTRIDLAAGWYFINEDVGDDDDDFIVNAVADKAWPFRRGLVGITLLSGYQIADSGAEDLGLNIYYEAITRAEFDFTPRFTGTATIGYRYDDFPRAEPDSYDWQTLTGAAGLEYQAFRWMFLNLDYSYRDRRSDIEFDEYTENRVLFSITITPPQPFRSNW